MVGGKVGEVNGLMAGGRGERGERNVHNCIENLWGVWGVSFRGSGWGGHQTAVQRDSMLGHSERKITDS